MADQKSHVNRPVERVEEEIHVHIFPQFAAPDAAAQRGIGLLTAWFQETFAKSHDQAAVALSGAKHGRDDASAPAAKNFYQLAHLLAHVCTDGTGVREVQLAGRTAGKRVYDKSGLIRPPAVNSCLANVGVSGHSFDRQFRETIFRQQFQRAAQDGQARLLAAWTPRSALAAASVAIPVSRRLLAHGLTLPYNRDAALESNTGSIESKLRLMGFPRRRCRQPLLFIRTPGGA